LPCYVRFVSFLAVLAREGPNGYKEFLASLFVFFERVVIVVVKHLTLEKQLPEPLNAVEIRGVWR
jgi:hypothetical protein